MYVIYVEYWNTANLQHTRVHTFVDDLEDVVDQLVEDMNVDAANKRIARLKEMLANEEMVEGAMLRFTEELVKLQQEGHRAQYSSGSFISHTKYRYEKIVCDDISKSDKGFRILFRGEMR